MAPMDRGFATSSINKFYQAATIGSNSVCLALASFSYAAKLDCD